MYTHSTKSNILIFWSIWILLTVKYFKQVKYKSASDIDHPRKLKKYNIHSKQISRQSHLNFPQNSKDDMCMLPWYPFKDLLSAAMIHVFGSFYQLKMKKKTDLEQWTVLLIIFVAVIAVAVVRSHRTFWTIWWTVRSPSTFTSSASPQPTSPSKHGLW